MDISFTTGERIRIWGGWYRHDTVTVEGVQLEGYIQVRKANHRSDTITVFRDSCVLGHDWPWLHKMNQQSNVPTS